MAACGAPVSPLPLPLLAGLCIVPYLDRDPAGQGRYFARERWLSWSLFLLVMGLFAAVTVLVAAPAIRYPKTSPKNTSALVASAVASRDSAGHASARVAAVQPCCRCTVRAGRGRPNSVTSAPRTANTCRVQSWRLRFLGGIVLGGLLAALAAGTWSPGFDAGLLRTAPGWLQAPLLLVGGGLLGYGARLAGGCTSGHGIVGMAQLARSSLVATGLFMVAGAAVTFAVLRLA